MSETSFIDFSKPFIEACKNIFATMVDCSLTAKKPEIKKDTTSRGDVTAFIGLSGELDK